MDNISLTIIFKGSCLILIGFILLKIYISSNIFDRHNQSQTILFLFIETFIIFSEQERLKSILIGVPFGLCGGRFLNKPDQLLDLSIPFYAFDKNIWIWLGVKSPKDLYGLAWMICFHPWSKKRVCWLFCLENEKDFCFTNLKIWEYPIFWRNALLVGVQCLRGT